MTSVSVDHEAARRELQRAWERIDDATVAAPASVLPLIQEILQSEHVTFKYVLVTGLLAKATDSRVHPRALQTGSRLRSSYDARSLCHKVVVCFEMDKGDLWGLSNEPFVNKPARHREHDKHNPQLRDKTLAAALHDALEFAHRAERGDVVAMLVETLREGKRRAESQVAALAEDRTTCRRVVEFISEFLRESDGGSRLVAVVGAFAKLLNETCEVKVYPPTYSDRFAGIAGDIEILSGKVVISAFDCKHRPLRVSHVRHGVRKARRAGIAEYFLITAAGFASDDEDSIQRELAAGCGGLDVHLVKVQDVTPWWAAVLNPVKRGQFGGKVTEILRTAMRRSGVANQAATLWNRLKQ